MQHREAERRFRIAVLWPRPRADRWRLGQDLPQENPDLSDALLFLEKEGFEVVIEESTPLLLNPLARMHEMWSGLDLARSLRLLLRYRRYDLIVGVGDAVAYFLAMARRCLGLRRPIVLIDPALSYHYPRRKRLQDQILPYVEKVIVFGQVQLDYLREQYGDRIDAVFVPHRLDTDFFCPGVASPRFTTGGPYILAVGDDISRDFNTLLRATQLCRAAGRRDFRCLIKTRLPVAADIADVDILGSRLSWVDLRDLYRGARLVVLPLKDTLHAGGINALLEGMAVGRPVVVSGSQGIRDYVKHEETALLVPPGDADALAGAMMHLMDSADDAKRVGENARRFVVDTCGNAIYARTLATLFKQVIATARGSDLPSKRA